MSLLTILPSWPVPLTKLRLIPLSCARVLARGETFAFTFLTWLIVGKEFVEGDEKQLDFYAETNIDALERSNPPAIIHNVSAAAIIAKGAFWFKIFNKLRGDKKASLEKVNIIINNTIRINTAYSLIKLTTLYLVIL